MHKFIVGPKKKEFMLHKIAVGRLSEDALLTNDSGVTALRDVDEETFICFCKYVYAESYTPPPPVWNTRVSADSSEKDCHGWPIKPQKNHANVYFYHVRVGMFAIHWGIWDLHNLAVDRLQGDLETNGPYAISIEDWVRLIHRIFDDPDDYDRGLGQHLSKYVARNIKKFDQVHQFLDLVETLPKFARDLVSELARI